MNGLKFVNKKSMGGLHLAKRGAAFINFLFILHMYCYCTSGEADGSASL